MDQLFAISDFDAITVKQAVSWIDTANTQNSALTHNHDSSSISR